MRDSGKGWKLTDCGECGIVVIEARGRNPRHNARRAVRQRLEEGGTLTEIARTPDQIVYKIDGSLRAPRAGVESKYPMIIDEMESGRVLGLTAGDVFAMLKDAGMFTGEKDSLVRGLKRQGRHDLAAWINNNIAS